MNLVMAGALIGSALAAVSACSSNSCGAHTAIATQSVRYASPRTPLQLQATLTSDGKPLPGFRLSFFLQLTGPTALVGKSGKTGDLLGYATTGADGVATYRLPSGVEPVILPGERPVGYHVSLTTGNKINGKYYCDANSSASFS